MFVMVSHERGPDVFHDLGVGWDAYDGAYFYSIAISPLHAASHLDSPTYRYQRILYPLLARIIGLGQPGVISYALVLLNIFAIVAGTKILSQIFARWGISSWYALIYAFFIGQWVVIRFDTSESVCYMFVLGAILATERKNRGTATLLFTLAMLTKELALYFIAAYAIAYAVRKRWLDTLRITLCVFPYAMLQAGLWLWQGELSLAAGPGPAFAQLPFYGYLEHGLTPATALMPLLLLLPAVIGVGIGSYFLVQQWPAVDPTRVALLMNALLIIFLPSEACGEMRAAGRIGIGLVLAMLLCGARFQSKRILNYGLLWIPMSLLFLPSLLFGI